MNTALPSVSCIMPTANRELFIPRAVEYYLRQDYPNKELIVVDDGINSIEHLLPENTGIRYKRLDKVHFIGEKRNIACELASGDIVLHWDDDDWYAPDWISKQVEVMIITDADICGLSQLYFFDPSVAKSWKYVYPAHDRPWVAGASMAYKRTFWERNNFKNLKIGEDNYFVWNIKCKIERHNYIDGLVAVIHPQNTSRKTTANPRWKPVPVSVIQSALKKDFEQYLRQR